MGANRGPPDRASAQVQFRAKLLSYGGVEEGAWRVSRHLLTVVIWGSIAYGFGFLAFGLFDLFNATEQMDLGEILLSALRAGLTWPMILIEAYTTPK